MQAGSSSASDHLDRAVFVAVVAVNEVQAAVHQVVHLPAVRHLRVVAVLPVPVTGLMLEFGRVQGMAPRAVGGVAPADLDGVLLQRTVLPQEVQVAALEDVDVVLMPDAELRPQADDSRRGRGEGELGPRISQKLLFSLRGAASVAESPSAGQSAPPLRGTAPLGS